MDQPAPPVLLYTLAGCIHCVSARRLLRALDIPFEERAGDGVPGFRALLAERTGRRTVPQVLIRDEPIGGASDLARLERRGVLMARVSGQPFPVARVRRRLSAPRLVAAAATAPFGGRCSPWRHVLELRDRDGRLVEREVLPSAEHAREAERALELDGGGDLEAGPRVDPPGA